MLKLEKSSIDVKKASILVVVINAILAFLISGLTNQELMRNVFHALQGTFQPDENLVLYILENGIAGGLSKARWLRMDIIFLVLSFIAAHFIYDLKKLYDFLFKYRFIIAGILLLFLVANGLHGDSLACYDYYIQHGEGSEFVYPVLGKERELRTDEWMVNSPMTLNWLLRDGVVGRPGVVQVLMRPSVLLEWIVSKVFGIAGFYSFCWYFPIFLGGLLTFEFFRYMTKDRRGVSMLLTLMIYCSSFFQWWNTPTTLMLSLHGALLFFALYFKYETWKTKIPCLYLTVVFALQFVRILYPAWQVPFGYVALLLGIWILLENKEKLKKMPTKEKGMLLLFIVLAMVALYYFFVQNKGYFDSILGTEYPGHRVDNGGGWNFYKLFGYIPALFYGVTSSINASENSMIISLFPIPMLLTGYRFYKEKKLDYLKGGLMVVSVVFLIYTLIGIPKVLASVTMLGWSTSVRCADVIGYLQILLLAALARDGMFDVSAEKVEKKNIKLIVVSCTLSFVACLCAHSQNEAIPKPLYGILFALFAFLFYTLLDYKNLRWRKAGVMSLVFVCIFTGIFIRPISYGFDAITSKPLYQKIQSLRAEKDSPEEDTYLAYDSIIMQSYLKASGANVVNFVNTTPNILLYLLLDPEGKYVKIWNRYEHVKVVFSDGDETSFSLLQNDQIEIELAWKDLVLLNVDYIVSQEEISADNPWFQLKKEYDEAGVYIYSVEYSDEAKEYKESRY